MIKGLDSELVFGVNVGVQIKMTTCGNVGADLGVRTQYCVWGWGSGLTNRCRFVYGGNWVLE